MSAAKQIERIACPNEETFRRQFVERGRPVVISDALAPDELNQWTFEKITDIAGRIDVPVYDWGDSGPTIGDQFVIRQMHFSDAITRARNVVSPATQRYSICQLPIEALTPVMERWRTPDFLKHSSEIDRLPALFSERPRKAFFISFFRGMHWHNGREAVATLLSGRKRFVLFHPSDTRFLYPRRFIGSGLSWFDEREAVFCSEIPFELGIDAIDRKRYPKFAHATPYEVELRPGDSLYIPTHWWHYTVALEPCAVLVEFWDAPLSRWGFPIARRSLLMKPYRKYLFQHVRKWRNFSRHSDLASA